MHPKTLLLDYLNPYFDFDSESDVESAKSVSGISHFTDSANQDWAIDVAILMSLRNESASVKLSAEVALLQAEQELLELEAEFARKKAEMERLLRERN